jgi:ABC-type enterochelin transport system ATPase subunit
MLEAHQLIYTIGKTVLLQDISTTFEPDKLNLIIGPNGAVSAFLGEAHPKR